MLSEMLPNKLRGAARNTITNIVLVTNAFVWYYLAIKILYDIAIVNALDNSTTLLMWSLHFAAITFSALAGASLVNKVGNRTRFLAIWMTLGIVSSVVSMLM